MAGDGLAEIVKRSENGPYMKEPDFELTLVKRTAELVAEYGLAFGPQVPVPSDDDMADRLYQAGLDLFFELGAYNQTTERRILFSREEVESTVAAAPSPSSNSRRLMPRADSGWFGDVVSCSGMFVSSSLKDR